MQNSETFFCWVKVRQFSKLLGSSKPTCRLGKRCKGMKNLREKNAEGNGGIGMRGKVSLCRRRAIKVIGKGTVFEVQVRV